MLVKRPTWKLAAVAALLILALAAALVVGAFATKPARAAGTAASFEAETMHQPSGTGQVFGDPTASGGRALLIWSDATASKRLSTPAAGKVVVRVEGDQCDGFPRLTVKIDGRQVIQGWVWQTDWTDYAANVHLGSGRHTVQVAFDHDYRTSTCDRNLRVDKVSFVRRTAASPTSSADPFSGQKLFVDPYSDAEKQASAWRSSRPEDAREMDKISAQPEADWFGDWNGDVRAAVDERVTTITKAGALPVLVAYDIPGRDCGGYSGGGASSADAYRAWIRAFAEGIGGRRAVVVLEPDALSLSGCLSASDKSTRLALMKDAVPVLKAEGAAVYIDAGHPGWVSAAEMSDRLKEAGIAGASGFSLNVSSFQSTSDDIAYGKDLSSKVGGKHFVIDTSRNGLGPSPDDGWCNPPGRALGPRPTTSTGQPLVDAYLWIKAPGGSDGACNGGPSPGSWWPEYALGLAQRAAY